MNAFIKAWEKVGITADTHPPRGRNCYQIEYAELLDKINRDDQAFADEMAACIYAGDFFLVKRAFSAQAIEILKDRARELWRSGPSTFYKMLEGVPNYHRVIGPDLSQNYYAYPVKHSAYFFPWNSGSKDVFPLCREQWGVLKVLAGLERDQYEKNTPKDNIVDRIQVVHYPRGGGKIDVHQDPYLSQNIVSSVYLSTRGADFETGGAFVVNQDDEVVDVEQFVEAGDMGFSFPTIAHGVRPVDPDREIEWQTPAGGKAGRWWIGMFSNFSDHMKDRPTGAGYSAIDITKLGRKDLSGLAAPAFI